MKSNKKVNLIESGYPKNPLMNFFYILKLNVLSFFGKKYIREGQCNGCGHCCKNISVKHGKNIIKDLKQFEILQRKMPLYRMFKVLEVAEDSVIFQCIYLDEDTGKCLDYENRPPICRNYPHEVLFKIGGHLSETCGFSFRPIKSFEKILSEVEKK